MDIKRVFAVNLRRVRREAGLSQEQLAGLAGIDRTYVSSLERCVYAVSIDKVERIAVVLGVTESMLLDRGPLEPPHAAPRGGEAARPRVSRQSRLSNG